MPFEDEIVERSSCLITCLFPLQNPRVLTACGWQLGDPWKDDVAAALAPSSSAAAEDQQQAGGQGCSYSDIALSEHPGSRGTNAPGSSSSGRGGSGSGEAHGSGSNVSSVPTSDSQGPGIVGNIVDIALALYGAHLVIPGAAMTSDEDATVAAEELIVVNCPRRG